MSNNKDHFISWQQLHRDSRQLASELMLTPWLGIIGIARGGMIPATIVARELNIRLLDSLCISSYDHDKQGEASVIKTIDGIKNEGEGFIIIDDLVDTGTTAKIARKLFPKAHFVTLYAKPKGKPFTDRCIQEFPQDCWLHFPWDSEQQESNYRYSEPLIEQQLL
jgi:xanthine phosphoribosyltransferase